MSDVPVIQATPQSAVPPVPAQAEQAPAVPVVAPVPDQQVMDSVPAETPRAPAHFDPEYNSKVQAADDAKILPDQRVWPPVGSTPADGPDEVEPVTP